MSRYGSAADQWEADLTISNFLLWESAYAEFVFLDTLWPDFSRTELWRAIGTYVGRDRRFGGAVDRPDDEGDPDEELPGL